MNDEPITLIDGGLSTALAELGHRVDGPLWTGQLLLDQPNEVVSAHRAFVDAGAEIIITGAYQLSYAGGQAVGWGEVQTDAAFRNSTIAARMAAGEETLVAASIGPYGATLPGGAEFTGFYDVGWDSVREFHARRLEVILSTEPDLLAIETMPDLREIDVILSLMDELDAERPLWVSCTIGEMGLTRAGQAFSEVVARVESHDSAIAVGINCSAPDLITPTLEAVDTDLPFILYPNRGQVWDGNAQEWIGNPQGISNEVLGEWVTLGARIIGGCCGYGAAEIRQLGVGLASISALRD